MNSKNFPLEIHDDYKMSSSLTNRGSDIETMSVSTAKSHPLNSSEKKATHSEIEKRRRQKMNKHLNELVFNLPVTSNKNKKPDKITILKMAVQHMKNLKASTSILSDSFLCQNYITPIELQSMVIKESNEFLIVIRCDSSKILYASESCYNCIGFLPSELIDRVFFEIVHPSDTKQVKDQLVYHDMNYSNATNNFMINKSRSFTTGERRSFVTRIRSHNTNLQPNLEYKLVHFVGYLRSDLCSNLKYTDPMLSDSTGFTSLQQQELKINDSSSANNSNNKAQPTFDSANNKKNLSSSFYNCHSITLLNKNEKNNLKLTTNNNHKSNQSNSNDQLPFSSNSVNKSSSSSSSNVNISSNGSTSQLNCNSNQLHYLIAYGQIKPKREDAENTNNNSFIQQKFMSRHDADGKFIYVDPSVQLLTGYMPHQLISESIFNLVHPDDVTLLRNAFQEAINILKNHKIRTYHYRFRLENSNLYATIESVLFALHNPFSNQFEYIVAQNKICFNPLTVSNNQMNASSYNSFNYNYNINDYNNTNLKNQTNNQPNQQQQQQQQQQTQGKGSYQQLASLINNSGISMPMTPSPEEYIYTNNSDSNQNQTNLNNQNDTNNDKNNLNKKENNDLLVKLKQEPYIATNQSQQSSYIKPPPALPPPLQSKPNTNMMGHYRTLTQQTSYFMQPQTISQQNNYNNQYGQQSGMVIDFNNNNSQCYQTSFHQQQTNIMPNINTNNNDNNSSNYFKVPTVNYVNDFMTTTNHRSNNVTVDPSNVSTSSSLGINPGRMIGNSNSNNNTISLLTLDQNSNVNMEDASTSSTNNYLDEF